MLVRDAVAADNPVILWVSFVRVPTAERVVIVRRDSKVVQGFVLADKLAGRGHDERIIGDVEGYRISIVGTHQVIVVLVGAEDTELMAVRVTEVKVRECHA